MADGRGLGVLLCLSVAMSSLPGSAQETDLLPEPGSTEMADRADVVFGSLGMTKCTNAGLVSGGSNLLCFFVLTQTKYEQRDYTAKTIRRWKPRLIDDLGTEHELITLYLLDGRGQQQEKVNLAKGQSVWFAAEFAGDGEDDITAVRVVFSALKDDPQLNVPVEPSE